ncbi:hypothetical protein [Flexivirga sp.]|uniref:hypothetical protein n=1 Tax=Flexivirga sp. TaxID=1962927 RepID=UPI003F81AA19
MLVCKVPLLEASTGNLSLEPITFAIAASVADDPRAEAPEDPPDGSADARVERGVPEDEECTRGESSLQPATAMVNSAAAAHEAKRVAVIDAPVIAGLPS